MDMEQYFYETQKELEKIIEYIDELKICEYHIKSRLQRDKTLKELKKLYEEFEF